MAQAPCGAVPERLFGEVVLRVPQTKDLSTWTFTPCVVPRLASKKLGLQQRSQGTQTTLGMWGTQLLWGNGIFGVHKQPRRDIYIYRNKERYMYIYTHTHIELYFSPPFSLIGNENSAQSFSDRSFWKSLGLWTSTPSGHGCPRRNACFARILTGLTEVLFFLPGYPCEWPPDIRGMSVRQTSSFGWVFRYWS